MVTLDPVVTTAMAGLTFMNVAKFSEIVMRSQHRVFQGVFDKQSK